MDASDCELGWGGDLPYDRSTRPSLISSTPKGGQATKPLKKLKKPKIYGPFIDIDPTSSEGEEGEIALPSTRPSSRKMVAAAYDRVRQANEPSLRTTAASSTGLSPLSEDRSVSPLRNRLVSGAFDHSEQRTVSRGSSVSKSSQINSTDTATPVRKPLLSPNPPKSPVVAPNVSLTPQRTQTPQPSQPRAAAWCQPAGPTAQGLRAPVANMKPLVVEREAQPVARKRGRMYAWPEDDDGDDEHEPRKRQASTRKPVQNWHHQGKTFYDNVSQAFAQHAGDVGTRPITGGKSMNSEAYRAYLASLPRQSSPPSSACGSPLLHHPSPLQPGLSSFALATLPDHVDPSVSVDSFVTPEDADIAGDTARYEFKVFRVLTDSNPESQLRLNGVPILCGTYNECASANERAKMEFKGYRHVYGSTFPEPIMEIHRCESGGPATFTYFFDHEEQLVLRYFVSRVLSYGPLGVNRDVHHPPRGGPIKFYIVEVKKRRGIVGDPGTELEDTEDIDDSNSQNSLWQEITFAEHAWVSLKDANEDALRIMKYILDKDKSMRIDDVTWRSRMINDATRIFRNAAVQLHEERFCMKVVQPVRGKVTLSTVQVAKVEVVERVLFGPK